MTKEKTKSTRSAAARREQLARQKLLLGYGLMSLAGLVLLLFMGLILTSPLLDSLLRGPGPEPKSNVRLVSEQRAIEACAAEAQANLGTRLQSIHYDGRSSRYVPELNQYHMFFDLIMAQRSFMSRDPHVICFISAADAEIEHFRVRGTGSGLIFFN